MTVVKQAESSITKVLLNLTFTWNHTKNSQEEEKAIQLESIKSCNATAFLMFPILQERSAR